MDAKEDSQFRSLWSRLENIRDRALSGGPVQGVCFHADDLTAIGKGLLEVILSEHPEIPKGSISIFTQKEFFDFGLSAMRGLFSPVTVQPSSNGKLKRHIEVWYSNEEVKQLTL